MPRIMLTLVTIVLLVVVFFSGMAVGLKAAKKGDDAGTPAGGQSQATAAAGDGTSAGATTADLRANTSAAANTHAGKTTPSANLAAVGQNPSARVNPAPRKDTATTSPVSPGGPLIRRFGPTGKPTDTSGATPEQQAALAAEAERARQLREESLYRLPSDYRLRALEYARSDSLKLTDEQKEQVRQVAEKMLVKSKAELEGTMRELEQSQAAIQELYRRRSEVQQGLDQQYMDQLRTILTPEQLEVVEGRAKPNGQKAPYGGNP